MREIKGDILKVSSDVIVQQVNCQGVMGSGLAKQIRDKYPIVYEKYKEYCRNVKPEELLGFHQVVKIEEGKFVVNIFGQLNYGRDGNIVYTDYKALEGAISTVIRKLDMSSAKSIAFPKNIGCGLANGDWSKVYQMIKKASACTDKEVLIVEYDK